MFDDNDFNEARALWQTLRLSFASCDRLTFLFFGFEMTNSVLAITGPGKSYFSCFVAQA